MLKYLTVEHFANAVCMLRSKASGAVLLASPDEAPFYAQVLADGAVPVVASQPLDVLRLVQARNVSNVAAAISAEQLDDRDKDSVFVPDGGDLRLFLLASPALQKVALEYTIGNLSGLIPLDNVYSFVTSVARLAASDGVARHDLMSYVLAKLTDYLHRPHIFEDGMIDLSCPPDLALETATLLLSAHKVSETCPESADRLLSALRLAYDMHCFHETRLFWTMHMWELARPAVRLVRDIRRREAFGTLLDHSVLRSDLASYEKGTAPLALIKMDLDNFKAANDAATHSGGDLLLQRYFEIVLRECNGRGDVYRRGGDEVVALLPFAVDDIVGICERIRSSVEIELRTVTHQLCGEGILAATPTVSIGATIVANPRRLSAAAQFADALQKTAKDQGKNRVVFKEFLDDTPPPAAGEGVVLADIPI